MKQPNFSRAFKMFETFKSYKLTTEDLNQAEVKADKLDGKSSDFKMLIRMAKDTFAGRYKMSTWNLSVIVGTIIYVVSPLDAVPDFIPVLGWLDDVTIVGYALSKLSEEIKKYKNFVNH